MKLFCAFLLSCFVANAATYEVHPLPDTRMALTVEKTGLYRGKMHLFLFEKYEGRLEFDTQKPEASKIELTIDSRSLVCKDDWVSASDLKKVEQTAFDDMLAVKDNPSMAFRSVSIKPLGAARYEAQGTLTIRGLAKPVLVNVELAVISPSQLRLSGNVVIRLTDYKLKPPSELLGAIGTKDEMTLNFVVIATSAAK